MPDAWYNWNVNMQFNALKRRIDNMLVMEEDGNIRVLKGENPFPVNSQESDSEEIIEEIEYSDSDSDSE